MKPDPRKLLTMVSDDETTALLASSQIGARDFLKTCRRRLSTVYERQLLVVVADPTAVYELDVAFDQSWNIIIKIANRRYGEDNVDRYIYLLGYN